MTLREKISECLPRPDPLERPDYTEAEVQAIRACWNGQASERQQRMSLDYMIRAFGTHDTSYRPKNPEGTAFAEGRRHAGTTIIWMLFTAPSKTDPDKISAKSTEQGK